eukprot:13950818-Heterocapsa_arctica.AAC.1
MVLRLKIDSQAHIYDKRSARNLTVIARMPEDRSKAVKNHQTPSNTFKAIYTCTCTPAGPTDSRQ